MSANVIGHEAPDTKDYLASIGEIVVLLNHLETWLSFFTWELIAAKGPAAKSQNIGKRITANLDFMEKVDLTRALLVERYGEEKASTFVSVYKDLQKCCEIRNDVAHSQWLLGYGSDGNFAPNKKMNLKKAYERGKEADFSKMFEETNLEELQRYSRKITNTITKMSKYFLGLFHEELDQG